MDIGESGFIAIYTTDTHCVWPLRESGIPTCAYIFRLSRKRKLVATSRLQTLKLIWKWITNHFLNLSNPVSRKCDVKIKSDSSNPVFFKFTALFLLPCRISCALKAMTQMSWSGRPRSNFEKYKKDQTAIQERPRLWNQYLGIWCLANIDIP